MTYKPPFNLNDEILALVADIAQKIGKVEAFQQLNRNPRLRKENRIRTIHSSLAIENNTLSLEQVTAVVEGKRVLASPRTCSRYRMPLPYTMHWMPSIPFPWMTCFARIECSWVALSKRQGYSEAVTWVSSTAMHSFMRALRHDMCLR